jgi:hypothetical protein
MPARLYDAELPRLLQLEGRTTSYRFDLEQDPAWSQMDEPGVFVPRSLLRDFGVDVDRLGSHFAEIDWIIAATICRIFVMLEECIFDFAEREKGTLLASKSVTALLEEEGKHIALFRRFEKELLERRDAALFERVYGTMGERLRDRHTQRLLAVEDDAARHYLCWVNILFFEEFTLFLDARLQAEAAQVQPTWLSVHRLHRNEETQHVATDRAYLDALDLSSSERARLSQLFVAALFQDFHDTLGLSAGLRRAAELGLGEVCPEGLISQRPFFQQSLRTRSFKGTVLAAPYLRELLERKA